jgi:hypothetical protein
MLSEQPFQLTPVVYGMQATEGDELDGHGSLSLSSKDDA